jgi:hypothetical protein
MRAPNAGEWLHALLVASTANAAHLEGASTRRGPLTIERLRAHVAGRGERVGAMPWTDAERVAWACVDIDGTALALHAEALVRVAKGDTSALGGGHPRVVALVCDLGERLVAASVPYMLERSRSGNWHVWILLAEPMPAATVRAALRPLLRRVGLPAHADDLTPRSDVRGEVGNGVYLPLYGGDTDGRSRFVERVGGEWRELPVNCAVARAQREAIERLAHEDSERDRAAQGEAEAHAKATRALVERWRRECPRFRAAYDSRDKARASEDDFGSACALVAHGVAETDAARVIYLRRTERPVGKGRAPRELAEYATRTARRAYSAAREECRHSASPSHSAIESDEAAFEAALAPDLVDPWPAPLGAEAYQGLAGDFLRLVEQESEACPAALLTQFLAATGCALGRTSAARVGAVEHAPRLWPLLVGPTARGAKGDSLALAMRPIVLAAQSLQRASGLTSGEGVLWAIRDPIRSTHYDRKRKVAEEYESDPGVTDKRLLVVESEFGRALAAMDRQGNTLSGTLRELWDGAAEVRALTKSSPARATAPHVVVVGHLTRDELRERLESVEVANGLANRFLFVSARRERSLPFGGDVREEDFRPIAARLAKAIEHASVGDEWGWDADAADEWAREHYPALTAERAGLAGAATAHAARGAGRHERCAGGGGRRRRGSGDRRVATLAPSSIERAALRAH